MEETFISNNNPYYGFPPIENNNNKCCENIICILPVICYAFIVSSIMAFTLYQHYTSS